MELKDEIIEVVAMVYKKGGCCDFSNHIKVKQDAVDQIMELIEEEYQPESYLDCYVQG